MRMVTGDKGQRAGSAGARGARPGHCWVHRGGWRRVVAFLSVALVAAGARGDSAAKGYVAVFVDGRTLHVAGARLIDEERLALDLGDGAVVTVPIVRIERVIEAETADEAAPIVAPACPTAFCAQPLPPNVPFRGEIERASKAADLHPWLVAAVVEAESAFDPWAVSRVGARGLMQLMPAVWLENAVLNPHDVEANLRAGCRHLKALLARFADVSLALAAYNAGAATVERAAGVPAYRETREFVRRVLEKFCPASPPAEEPAAAGVSGAPGEAAP